MTGLLDSLHRAGRLRTLDHALGASLRRLDPATHDLVAAGAALASLAVAHGHAGFDPARPQPLLEGVEDWPAASAWQDALLASPWVAQVTDGEEATAAPLVLERGLLYLRRYREYERRLAARLLRLATTFPDTSATSPEASRGQGPEPVQVARVAPLFARLFPSGASDPRQARAAALALVRSLLLVTGGPGTGKTTTIARLLLLLIEQARLAGRAPPRIALAAPTGRAAERMAESLRSAAEAMRALPGVDPLACDALPTAASTLHRLLGTIPDSPRFRHDAGHPLPLDVVVVDEASMVDLPLMCKLAEAVPDGARLILLGDPDQLPSVEAGDVLAAICEAAGTDETVPDDIAELLGAPVGGAPASTRIVDIGETADLFEQHGIADGGSRLGVPFQSRLLQGHRVHLRRGYRQSHELALAPLAEAVRDGDADRALALLRGGTLAGVHFHEDALDPLQAGGEPLLSHWRGLATIDDPAAALAQAGRLRLLTALRAGPQGAQALNARVEEALAGAHRPAWFHGRLLLVTENSYRHRLFNGDVGLCLRDGDGAVVAWFPGGQPGTVRPFHPASLPAHESAFAMTVHKAQGSEFDAVWLQLPRADNRVLSRELVYTALTRARRELHLCASEAVLGAALARHVTRVSGLAARLAG